MKLKRYFDKLKLNIKFTIVTIFVTAIPIAILAGFLFYNMEQDVISEHLRQMEYKMEQARTRASYGVDSINMTTQFFATDDEMSEVLKRAKAGQSMTVQELLDFQERDIINLQRLVNNNPLLYAVRIYGVNNQVQELMPILYNKSRMENMNWSKEDSLEGWHYDYYDTAFSSLITNQTDRLACLITPITDYQLGTIGYIEASMRMDTLFPDLYNNEEKEWNCLLTADNVFYFGDSYSSDMEQSAKSLYEKINQAKENQALFVKQGNKKLIVSYVPVHEIGGALLGVEDITEAVHAVYHMRNTFVVVMIFILILLAVLIDLIVRRMLRQFYAILENIRRVQTGDLGARIDSYTDDEMSELGNQLNEMLDRIQELMDENIKREILVKNSEIRALQNQINAHFIYNVLESIKMMAEIDEKYEISDAITALGKLLRYSMRWVSGNVKLEEELEYIKSYLVLINLRYDYEIVLSLSLPDVLYGQEIPKMSLQPIVENAILHGIEPLSEDSTIYIKGWMEADDCVIEITDAGQGMTDAEVKYLEAKIGGEVEPSGGDSHGIGLKNVQDRIHMSFGKDYGLSIASKYGCYTKIAIRLPRNVVKKPPLV